MEYGGVVVVLCALLAFRIISSCKNAIVEQTFVGLGTQLRFDLVSQIHDTRNCRGEWGWIRY